jgi:hypothetical protein
MLKPMPSLRHIDIDALYASMPSPLLPDVDTDVLGAWPSITWY